MRALIVSTEAPPVVSGIARCVGELHEGLEFRGHDIDVVSCQEVPRVEFGQFRFSAMAARLPALARRLSSYDVVNVHGPTPTFSDLTILMLAAMPPRIRPPIVYTHHSSVQIEGLEWLMRPYNAAHEAAGRVADRVLVSSPSYREILTSRGVRRVDVVPWGGGETWLDVERAPTRADSPLRVLFLGQMRPYKGIEVLLEALTRLDGRVCATLAGGGSHLEHYRQTAALLRAPVSFPGRVPDDELRALFASHDVLVLPSTTRAEAFGLVLLEGMSAGMVPVASNLPGVCDVVGTDGLLAEPGDVASLAQQLDALASDRAMLERLSAQARGRARSMTWRTTVDRYERILCEAATGYASENLVPLLPRRIRPPEETLKLLREDLGAATASLMLFDRTRDRRLRGFWRADTTSPGPLPTFSPVARWVAEKQQPLVVTPDTVPTPLRRQLLRSEISSALTVPVPCRWGRTAVVNLSRTSGTGDPFTEKDLVRARRLLVA